MRYCSLVDEGNEDSYERQSQGSPSSARSMRLMKVMRMTGSSTYEGGAECDTDNYDWGNACANDCCDYCPFEDNSSSNKATGIVAILLALGMSVCACFGCFNS